MTRQWVAQAVLMLLLALTAALPAHADTRVAMVIGNGAYAHAPQLPNPTRDAADMASALRGIGFGVTEIDNAGRQAMEQALSDFAETAAGADLAIVYYAGHGMELDNNNYLIPVDAELASDRRVQFETVSLGDVLAALDGVKGVRIVLLDACRNNPFADQMTVTVATRSISRGLGRIDAGSGTVISFAAKAGNVAADGDGRNSPFTTALLANIATPGVDIDLLLRRVRDKVLADTHGAQEPYVSSSLSSQEVFLVPPGASASTPEPAPAAGESIAADFQLAKEVGTPEAWDAFLAMYKAKPDNLYVKRANAARQKSLDELVGVPRPRPKPIETIATAAITAGENQAKLLDNPDSGSGIPSSLPKANLGKSLIVWHKQIYDRVVGDQEVPGDPPQPVVLLPDQTPPVKRRKQIYERVVGDQVVPGDPVQAATAATDQIILDSYIAPGAHHKTIFDLFKGALSPTTPDPTPTPWPPIPLPPVKP